MDVFFTLLGNLAPLYFIIALGWIAGRSYNVDSQSLSSLAIYIIVPIVSFYYVASLEFQASYLALPLILFSLFTGLTFLFYALGRRCYPDKRANLLAMCAASANIGYLGLPVVISLFPPEWVGVYVFTLSGGILYESTVSYYIANRGIFSPKDSFKRVLKFPVLYAIIAGLFINLAGLELPSQLGDFWGYFKGAYIVIGMMIIGVALSKLARLEVSAKFLSIVFLGQFIVWPVLVLAMVTVDRAVLHWFEPQVHQLFIIMSVMPPAANTAAFAAQLDLNPEKAASTILIATIFTLFYIPAMLMLLGVY